MSAKLLWHCSPRQPVIHNSPHDPEPWFLLEYVFFILNCWSKKTEEELIECHNQLFNTFKLSILKTFTIQSNLTWCPKVVKYISPYFPPVIPFLNNLQNNITLPLFTNEARKIHCTPFDHDTIIQHIVELLSSLKPKAWNATSALDNSHQALDSPLIQCAWHESYSNPTRQHTEMDRQYASPYCHILYIWPSQLQPSNPTLML